MENSKLFKKLNEQMEINAVKEAPISETEINNIERKVIFENAVNETVEKVEFKTK